MSPPSSAAAGRTATRREALRLWRRARVEKRGILTGLRAKAICAQLVQPVADPLLRAAQMLSQILDAEGWLDRHRPVDLLGVLTDAQRPKILHVSPIQSRSHPRAPICITWCYTMAKPSVHATNMNDQQQKALGFSMD
ncbi:hypothetical protein [Streptomyces sp. NPDC005408]|uniref:hypothetical protein n=1 Tax=Streptomyces sp. NPDC005408 TaxID=3155341 RepID=UPI0033BF23B6